MHCTAKQGTYFFVSHTKLNGKKAATRGLPFVVVCTFASRLSLQCSVPSIIKFYTKLWVSCFLYYSASDTMYTWPMSFENYVLWDIASWGLVTQASCLNYAALYLQQFFKSVSVILFNGALPFSIEISITKLKKPIHAAMIFSDALSGPVSEAYEIYQVQLIQTE